MTISPTFRVRNLLRDTIQAMAIDSNLSTNPLRNLVEGWKATGAESDTWRRLMMAGGGAVRFGSFNDGNARGVKRLVDELGAHPDDVITSPAGMGRALRKAFDWYQETGDRSETINRAAIYQQARKAGRNRPEASYAARDLMDFTAGGFLLSDPHAVAGRAVLQCSSPGHAASWAVARPGPLRRGDGGGGDGVGPAVPGHEGR